MTLPFQIQPLPMKRLPHSTDGDDDAAMLEIEKLVDERYDDPEIRHAAHVLKVKVLQRHPHVFAEQIGPNRYWSFLDLELYFNTLDEIVAEAVDAEGQG